MNKAYGVEDNLTRAKALSIILADAAGGAEVSGDTMDAQAVSIVALEISNLIEQAEAEYGKERKDTRKVRLVETG